MRADVELRQVGIGAGQLDGRVQPASDRGRRHVAVQPCPAVGFLGRVKDRARRRHAVVPVLHQQLRPQSLASRAVLLRFVGGVGHGRLGGNSAEVEDLLPHPHGGERRGVWG